MADRTESINLLNSKLDLLLKKQDHFSKEISELRNEIEQLKNSDLPLENIDIPMVENSNEIIETVKQETINLFEQNKKQTEPPIFSQPQSKPKKSPSNLEKFIGENLINKIGIAITVVGVGIGAKYSIEHNLISPLTRIILGYLSGIGLLMVGMKLKKNYHDYSAVLVSGAMAIMYFITFVAFSIYDLIPQIPAFILMVVFTAFTVFAAISYSRQVIAHIGLVGAYAVPFLLSNDTGNVIILFSYVAIINIGILVLSFKRFWKPLYFSSFVLSWIIFISWFFTKYDTTLHFSTALTFISIFFAIFYITFLAYNLLRKEKLMAVDIILLLANSFIFYGFGYAILSMHSTGTQLLGLFTLLNGIIHFGVSTIIYKKQLVNKNLFYLISGLVLVFITITIPVQLDGNWVTIMWAGEAALLFWIGRSKSISVYENLSYALMIISFFSIMQDWENNYYFYQNQETYLKPIFNVHFLTSIIFVCAFAIINYLNIKIKYVHTLQKHNRFLDIMAFVMPAILLFACYNAFRVEIASYWDQLYHASSITISSGENTQFYQNYDMNRYKTVWILNYSMFFFSVLAFFNIKKIKQPLPGIINLVLLALTLIIFLTEGLHVLSELRETYLEQTLVEYYKRSPFNIGIRYISYLFVVLALISCYYYARTTFMNSIYKISTDFLIHGTILWILSSEFINWMNMLNSAQSFKLGLSILWGIYSLFLISVGIWKNKKHLRVGAIVLFAGTLVKLFYYDISHLNTISKTIVFISLGVLLLLISFLYNKYKHIITDENKD